MKPTQLVLLAGLCLSTLTFTSCDKQDVLPTSPTTPTTPATPPPPTNNTPQPVTTNSLLSELANQQYKYDVLNRLVEVSDPQDLSYGYTVVYEGNKASRLNYRNGSYALYTYDGDKAARMTVYKDNEPYKYFIFSYEGDKLISMTSDYHVGLGTSSTSEIFRYDANGNMKERSFFSQQGQHVYVLSYGSFDNKPNPQFFAEREVYVPGVKFWKNNPGSVNKGHGEIFFSYLYHDSGMPKQRSGADGEGLTYKYK